MCSRRPVRFPTGESTYLKRAGTFLSSSTSFVPAGTPFGIPEFQYVLRPCGDPLFGAAFPAIALVFCREAYRPRVHSWLNFSASSASVGRRWWGRPPGSRPQAFNV